MAGSTRTSKTAAETTDDASGVTGATVSSTDQSQDVQATEGSAPEDAKVEIIYKGSKMHTRRLNKSDFTSNEMEPPEETPVEWSVENKHTVDGTGWDEATLKWLDEMPDFQVKRSA